MNFEQNYKSLKKDMHVGLSVMPYHCCHCHRCCQCRLLMSMFSYLLLLLSSILFFLANRRCQSAILFSLTTTTTDHNDNIDDNTINDKVLGDQHTALLLSLTTTSTTTDNNDNINDNTNNNKALQTDQHTYPLVEICGCVQNSC